MSETVEQFDAAAYVDAPVEVPENLDPAALYTEVVKLGRKVDLIGNNIAWIVQEVYPHLQKLQGMSNNPMFRMMINRMMGGM